MTASPAATSSPAPTPTPDPHPERCHGGAETLDQRLAELEIAITEAMAGYQGEWGVGLVDLDCDIEFAVRPDYAQYTASAGKIVPIIAALRAVETGALDLANLEPPLIEVMRHSWDHEANQINDMVTPDQVQEVLVIAEVSDQTRFEYRWNQALMPALDLARVWAALLDGRLLDEELTEYLLDLAASPEIPDGLETFPVSPEIPGYELGQKAGYYVYDGVPYYLLGAGYLRPVGDEAQEAGLERSADPGHRGIALVFMARSTNPDLFDPQRREVFPLLLQYVLGEP